MRLIYADRLKRKCQKYAVEAWKMNLTAKVETVMNQFIDFIDAESTVDAEPVRQWISVKDRLPEPKINPLTQDFAWVICYCDFGGEPKRTDVRFYGFGKPSWAEKAHFMHGGQVMDGIVTHWMPLPELPEEDDDAKE